MTVKIFLTGATGYIGGDALYELTQAHPAWDYALLVRTQDKADQVRAQYPDARIVLGSLDDSELLKDEAAKADIVLHTADASDHEGAARAIAAGLVAGHTEARPGYWLHTGGTGILTYFDSRDGRLGERTEDEFDDWAGVGALTSLPDDAFHRHVDKVVLECGTAHAAVARTALVCPPTVYGTGRGPVATRSRQAYELARLVLRTGAAPIVGAGQARWRHVHVADLSAAFCRLAETAAAAAAADREEELWGARGYYLVEAGEHVWAEVARATARAAHALGFIAAPGREAPLGRQAALDLAGFEAVSWGLNARGRGERLRRLLGWAPARPSLEASLPEILRYEKARLE